MKLSQLARRLLVTPLVLVFLPGTSRAQFPNPGILRGSIFGRLVVAGDNRPAQGLRVELKLLTGGPVATTFTGWGGQFSFAELASGTYLVIVKELGFEPMQQTVQVDSGAQPLLLYLNKSSAADPPAPGNVVSVRELSIRPKARDAFQRGLRRLAENDPTGGVAQFQHAIAAFPGYYEAYYQIGFADLKLGRQADAEQAFRKSIQLSVGRFPQAHFGLGAILCDQGKFAEAETTIRKGLELDDDWIGHYYRARALFGLNRLDEAEKSASEVIFQKADLPEVYLLLGDIHIHQKNYSALLKDVDDYLKLDPDGPTSAEARIVQEKARRVLSESRSAATLTQPEP